MTLTTTCTPMQGGVDAVTGVGQQMKIQVTGTWTAADEMTVVAVSDINGYEVNIGAGPVSGTIPNFCFTYANKVYVLEGANVHFSDVALPRVFNDNNGVGNGYVNMLNFFSTPENLKAIAPYQGRLAFFSAQTTQIWSVAALPEDWQQIQVFPNIGTISSESVKPLGTLDVIFLSNSGIRSLRVRDSSLNAYVDDIGTQVDSLVRTSLVTTPAGGPTSCAVVEPTANRYWLYLNGIIYVLSYFPMSKVSAWSTYSPSIETKTTKQFTVLTTTSRSYAGLTIGATYYYQAGISGTQTFVCGTTSLTASGYFVANATTAIATYPADVFPTLSAVTFTTFVPSRMVVYNGQVYVRDDTSQFAVYRYGGSDNNTFDASVMSFALPWLPVKRPGTFKQGQAVDAALSGTWSLQAGTDPKSEVLTTVYPFQTQSTFWQGIIPFTSRGTHFRIAGTTLGNAAATMSSVIYHYEGGEEKK